MRKITLFVTLIGSVYLSNAQVGINTPTPNASAMLDIVSSNKGVLIPRVDLADTKSTLGGASTHENSLLVYNKATAGTGLIAVTPGFYYWQVDEWKRVISKSDLDAAINNQTADLDKIKALLNAAYGTNNLGTTPTTNDFGGMVFTPAGGGNSAKIEYVKWNPDLNGTNSGGYEKIDITSVISSLINANESKTLLYSTTDEKYQYYISETYLGNSANPAITQTVVDGWPVLTTLPAGVYAIDFVNGVSNNFLELSTAVTNITKPGGGFYTVKEYIEMLANTPVDGETRIMLTGAGTQVSPYVAKLQKWDATLSPPAWVDVDNSAFSEIVKDNEAKTIVKKLDDRTFYFSESFAGDASSITTAAAAATASGVYELHTGNTGYTTVEITTLQNPGGGAIPANSFYYINASNVKVEIPLNDIVYQGINQFTTTQVNNTKLKLGDNLSTTSFTGNTITVGGDTHYIYRGIYRTTVTAGSANTNGVTLGQSGSKILSIDVRYDEGMVASVTDLTLSGTSLGFKIGTGQMYFVLDDANDLIADVIIEFASATVPTGVTP